MKILSDKGADVNAKTEDGRSALMFASLLGHVDVVKVLLDEGADVHAKDKFGVTALMEASKKGYVDVVKVLLDEGADVNVKTEDGRSALMFACSWGHRDLVKDRPDKDTRKTIMEYLKDFLDHVGPLAGQKHDRTRMEGPKQDYVKVVKLLKAHGAKE
jgi:predicted LPLAT superfamily acyltransferase